LLPLDGIKVPRPLELLTGDEIHSIHVSALDVLGNIGVIFEERSALKILDESGCDVNLETGLVKFPDSLVEETVKKAPRSITLCGRSSDYDLKIENYRTYFAGGANAVKIVDSETFEARDATVNDFVNLTIISDALENVHCYLPIVWPQDVPPVGVDRAKCELALKNTVKHYFCDAEGRRGAEDHIEMASAVVGGEDQLRMRPIISIAPCITSPLCWGPNAVGVLSVMAEKSLPQIISSEPESGATSPVTLAGSLVQQNAEILSGIVLSQLISPRAPVLACTLPSVMDMRSANIACGSVELGLMCAAMAQIYRRYEIPYVGTGGIADSKIPDEQAAYEKALTALIPAQAGSNLIHLTSGMLESILAASYEQIVVDNEILGAVLRAARGIEVTPETLAVDTIKKVGPRGHFLAQKHTMKYLREEHYITAFTDRNTRRAWESRGRKDTIKRAKEIVQEILLSHKPEPLDKDVGMKLEEIRKRAQKETTA